MAKLSTTDYEYHRTEGAVSSIIFTLVKEHDWRIVALEIMPDHVHILMNAPTHESAAEIARWIKGRAPRYLRRGIS